MVSSASQPSVTGSSTAPDACAACGASDLAPHVRTRQLTLSRCRECDGLTAIPRPDPTVLAAFHDSSVYFDHPYFESRRVDRGRVDARSRDVLSWLLRVNPSFTGRNVRHLDVGCDTGIFLESFSRLYGTVPLGIDVAARAVAIARARGIDALHADLQHAGGIGRFGLITMIDVIEHVASPVELLRQVSERLERGGVCYLETPNIRSSIYVAGRRVCNATDGRPTWLCERLFLPEHVQYLSPRGLEAAAAAARLRVAVAGRRSLAAADVNAALPIRLGVQSLQMLDRAMGREILHCAVLMHD